MFEVFANNKNLIFPTFCTNKTCVDKDIFKLNLFHAPLHLLGLDHF